MSTARGIRPDTATEENEPEKFLSTKNLTDVLLKMSEVLEITSDNDPDMVCSTE